MSGSTYAEKYIVVFKDNVTPEQVEQYAKDVTRNGGQIFNRYSDVLTGFSAAIPDHFLSSLQESDIIAAFKVSNPSKTLTPVVFHYSEPDGIVTIQ